MRLVMTLCISAAALGIAAASASHSALASQEQALRAVNPADIDSTCAPCEDFYKYATGGWQVRTPIPPAFPAWSSFDELRQRNFGAVRAILESAARDADSPTPTDRRRLGRFYATCMDTAAVEARGARPLVPELTLIDGIRTREDLRRAFARLHSRGITIGFGFGSAQDARRSDRMIFQLSQGGLGLPDRDYYFRNDSTTLRIRTAYADHVAAMLELAGASRQGATKGAADVLRIEEALAQASLNRTQRRDPTTQYNPMSVSEAGRIMGTFPLQGYLAALGLGRVDSLNVAHPDFFRAFAATLESEPIDAWKSYLRYHNTNDAAPWLSSAFVAQHFAFTSALNGARELQPRWRRCLALSDRFLPDALGREYVTDAYSPAAQAEMNAMIDNLLRVYRSRLEKLPWMSPETRVEALKKLDTFGRKVGYPDAWKSYEGLEVDADGWFENARRAMAFENRGDLDQVGRPVDRGRWFMSAPTVNAYYSAANNEIAFPAGRLQPPFFHPSFDLAANYGGIGATIGHEISHGFDDQGRRYDPQGNLRDWWTEDDASRFEALAARMDDQYSAYTVLDGLPLKGRQTLGENIADNAGVSIAFEALQLALEGKPRTLIDGLTPEQRFFLGWAQARRQIWRDESLRLAVLTGVHSPGEFRVNGPLSNLPEFAAAFSCTSGDAMVRGPADRTVIW